MFIYVDSGGNNYWVMFKKGESGENQKSFPPEFIY